MWGWLAVATGIVWILAALGLWALQPWARWFALFMAGFALFEAVLAFFQFPGTGLGFSMAIMPALILWYLSTGEVKAVFGEATERGPGTHPGFAAPGARGAGRRRRAAAVAARRPWSRPRRPRTPRGARRAHQTRIADVEGIGPAYAEKLAAAGIATTDDLLAAGAKPYDREKIAQATGISGKLILHWVDNVDLMRVPGVGPQYSDLLEAAGVGLAGRARPPEPGQPRDHRPGGRRRAAGHRPSDPERGRDRGLDRAGGKLDMVVEH